MPGGIIIFMVEPTNKVKKGPVNILVVVYRVCGSY